MNTVDELLGADYSIHNILHAGLGLERAVQVLKEYHKDITTDLDPTGNNLGHMMYLEENFAEKKQDVRQARMTLSAIFGHRVLDRDISQYRSEHLGRGQVAPPRRSEGPGIFRGRTANRRLLRFEQHPFMIEEEDEE